MKTVNFKSNQRLRENSRTLRRATTLLALFLVSIGQMWGANGDVLFSQDFESVTALPYRYTSGTTTQTYTYSSTGTTLTGLVGTGQNLFTHFSSSIKKGDIAINSSTGGGSSVDATGIFQVYSNGDNAGYWSLTRTTDFAATAPTALKIYFEFWINPIGSGSANGVQFAIGDGFSGGLVSTTAQATTVVHSGFGLYQNSSPKITQYASTTALYNTVLSKSSWYSLVWVINNTGSDLTYDNPTGSGTTTLANDKFDIWLKTQAGLASTYTKVVSAAAATTANKDLQEIYIGYNNSGKKHEFRLDNIVVTDLTPATCITPTCSWATTPANGSVGGSQTVSVTTNYSGGLSYSSSDETVATITSAGVISYLKAGTTTITATVTGDGATYCTGPATCSQSITVTAAKAYTVTAATSTGADTYGTVSASASTADEGDEVTITAIPASGYRVASWAVSGEGSTIDPDGISNSTSTTLTVGTANATVTVTFEAIPTHSVSTAVTPVSSGTATAASSSVYEGETTTITATPANGNYVFDHWAVSGTGATLSSTTTNPTTLTMGTADVTVTATFEEICYDTIYNLTAGIGSEAVKASDATVNAKTSLVLSNTAGRITLKPKTGTFKNGDAISFGGTIGKTSKEYGIIIYDAGAIQKNTIKVNGTTSPLKASGTLTLSSDADSIFIARADGTTTTLTSCIIYRPIDCPEPLDAPTGLALSGGATTASSLTFTWTAVTNASSYDVYLYSNSACTVQVGDKKNTTGTSLSFTGLSSETQYWCKVKAVGDGSSYTDSEFSSAATGTTIGCTAPGAPTSLAATKTQTSISLTWTKGANITSQKVYLYEDDGETLATTTEGNPQVVTSSAENATFTGLDAGTDYKAKVQSIGDGSTYCEEGPLTGALAVSTDAAYAIVLHDNNGAASNGSATILAGATSLTISSVPTKDGYVVAGYYAEAGMTTLIANADGSLVADVDGYTDEDGKWTKVSGATLYAKWIQPLVTWSITTGVATWSTSSTPSTSDETNITSISTSANVQDNKTSTGCTAKLALATAENTVDKGASFTFIVASTKKVVPSSVSCQVFNVGSGSDGDLSFKAQLTDAAGNTYYSTNTVTPTTAATLTDADFTFSSGLAIRGAVTLTIYGWISGDGSGFAFRMGPDIKFYGEVADYTAAAISAPTISGTAAYNPGQTITLTSDEPTGSDALTTYA